MVTKNVYKADEEGLELSKKLCFELLLIVDRICREKKIEYWLDGGTLLAATRHKGFIPWDDDIDICLIFSEYEKLIEELKVFCNNSSKHILFHSDSPLKYCHDFFGNTEFLRDGITPVRIDIIPVKILPNDPEQLSIDRSLANIYSYYFQGFFKVPSEVMDIHFSFLPESFKDRLAKRNSFIDFYSTYMRSISYIIQNPETRVVNYSFNDAKVKKNRPYYNFNDIFPLSTVVFEGLEFPAPRNIHNYLIILYGENYLTPPPITLRKSHFQRLYKSNISKNKIKFLLNLFYYYGFLNLNLPKKENNYSNLLSLIFNFISFNFKLVINFQFKLLVCLYRYSYFKLNR